MKTEKIILGSIMKDPLLLSQTEKYIISVDDFDNKAIQHIFYAIAQIAADGSTRIETQDVHIWLQNSPTGLALFENINGVSLLNDAIKLANEESFNTYYNLFKKENLLRDLKKMGIDTTEFYDINPLTNEAVKINDKYNNLELKDIIDAVRIKVLKVESSYLRNDASETRRASDGIREMLEDLEERPDIGPPLQGDIFNTITAGARRGCFYVRSAASGTGKTRSAVADACYLAYPLRYNQNICKWEFCGGNEKTLFIATEQNFDEIQKMMLAYLTGFNESKFRYNKFNKAEKEIVQQALWVMERYKDNMFIVRMPNPSIEIVKAIVRENVLLHDVGYIFYDYIFLSPSLLQEFRTFSLRNDEVLLLFSTALKDLAVELYVFIMTSTQVNAKADDNKDIRNEGSIAGARAIINKADVGCLMARPTREELETLKTIIENQGIQEPNIVLDVYKVRAGEWNQVRVWSYVDLGTLRKDDLFITDARLNVISNYEHENFSYDDKLFEHVSNDLIRLNGDVAINTFTGEIKTNE